MLESIPETLTHAVGLFGVAVYLGSYALLQLGVLRGTSYTYSSLNIVAAGSVAFSLIHAFNMSSLLIQVFWIAISLVGMARVYFLTRTVRFTTEENELLANKFPNLPKHLARRYLNLGKWKDLDPGAILTEHGKRVEYLSYMKTGSADVIVADEIVGHIDGQTVVGELTAMTDEMASATIRIKEPSRVFMVDTGKLQRFLKTNSEVDFALRATFVDAARIKLIRRNEELKQSRDENARLRASLEVQS